MTTYFLRCILFYIYNHFLLSYFPFLFPFLIIIEKCLFNRLFQSERISFVIYIYSIRLILYYFTGCILHLIWSLYWTKYLFLSIQKQPLGDLLKSNCSKPELNQLKYACESVLFLLLKLNLFTIIFQSLLLNNSL